MEQQVISILTDFLKEDTHVITLEDNLIGDLELTSLDILEIVTTFEDEFQIAIPDNDIVEFVVVRDLLEYVKKNEAL